MFFSVYLRADPEVCERRVAKRNRSEESGLSLVGLWYTYLPHIYMWYAPMHAVCSQEFLKSLHDLHDQWLIEKSVENCPDIPVLVSYIILFITIFYRGTYEKACWIGMLIFLDP